MYEHDDGKQDQARAAFPAHGAAADETDARAQARRALQDAYDWRDDESHAPSAANPAANRPGAAAAQDEPSAAERAAARRSRRQSVRSISRTVGV